MEVQPISQHFKIPISHVFHGVGKIGKSNSQQYSNISTLSLFVNWENMSIYTTQDKTFGNPHFESMDELGKNGGI